MKSPEFTIATLAVVGLGVIGVVAWWRWFSSGPLKPDPWSEEIAGQLRDPDSAPVCHHCLQEQSDTAHFCPQCGTAVGDYNNLLPFERIFSVGEVLRNGINSKVRPSPLVILGYLVLPLFIFWLAAPFYWYQFLRNCPAKQGRQRRDRKPIPV
jgi:hypothetical protein